MSILHEITIPVFLQYLERLELMLCRMADHCAATGMSEEALLARSLVPDMFDCRTQVLCAIGFSQRALAPLLPVCRQTIEPGEGMAGLIGATQQARRRLSGVGHAALDGREREICRDRAGDAELILPALDFVTRYALPNFFFHLSMAYAIARAAGVPLGKGDFDGWHAYAPGFSFVDNADGEA
jgi:uncharacterized protein